jgi:predicted Zn-dependent protease
MLAAVLALSLGGAPVGLGLAQSAGAGLPSLGDPSVAELSPAAERKLGEKIMLEIRRDPDFLEDVQLTEYLGRIGARLAEHTVKYADYAPAIEIFAVRDRSINAFALPGGFIGVHTGLIALARSEGELASVLAHEIAHVSQRHIARQLGKQAQQSWIGLASFLLAALAASRSPDAAQAAIAFGQAAAIQGQLNFSRDMEREADRIGLQLLTDAGFEPPAMLAFFLRMQQATKLADNNQFPYLRSHPLSGERVADVEMRLGIGPRPAASGSAASAGDALLAERLPAAGGITEFGLMALRARIGSESNADGWRGVREHCRALPAAEALAAQYCKALAALRLRDFEAAGRAAAAFALRAQAPRPIARLAAMLQAEVATEGGAPQQALALLAPWAQAEPLSRPVQLLHARAALAVGKLHGDPAALRSGRATLLRWTSLHRDDAVAWQLLGQVHAALGEEAQALRAAAEINAAQQQWSTAIGLLERARGLRVADYYEGSIIDARLRELRERLKAEMEEGRRRPASASSG